MSWIHPAWVEHQRKRWLRPDAERYLRPDAQRWLRPLHPDERKHAAPAPDIASDIEADVALEREALQRLRKDVATLTFEIKFRQLLRKAGFNPEQPRVPAGNPDGGQWTSGGGSVGQDRVRLAGEIPTDDPPDIPKKRLRRQRSEPEFCGRQGSGLRRLQRSEVASTQL